MDITLRKPFFVMLIFMFTSTLFIVEAEAKNNPRAVAKEAKIGSGVYKSVFP